MIGIKYKVKIFKKDNLFIIKNQSVNFSKITSTNKTVTLNK